MRQEGRRSNVSSFCGPGTFFCRPLPTSTVTTYRGKGTNKTHTAGAGMRQWKGKLQCWWTRLEI